LAAAQAFGSDGAAVIAASDKSPARISWRRFIDDSKPWLCIRRRD
jgi:hypothetical protein